MRSLAPAVALVALVSAGCRESSVACDIARWMASSEHRFAIESLRDWPILEACRLREKAAERAEEALSGKAER